jgi:beta-glucosidase
MAKANFPKRFLWGAAIAAHQVEGDQHNQWSVWELENAKGKAAQASYQFGDLDNWPQIAEMAEDPSNYVSGDAVNHYDRYEEDFDLLESMDMNALRFSVEWSRVEPQEGAWNAEAVTHYKRYAASLRQRGIEPVVTLFHFTLPVWFSELGGFEKRGNIQYFVRFAERMVRELGADVRLVLTINEPVVYAWQSYGQGDWPPNLTSKWKAVQVLNNLARAHRQAAAKIRAINRRYRVSLAKNSVYFYAGDDAWLSVKSAQVMQYAFDDYFLKKVVKHCDFLGVNYYLSERVYGYRMHNPNKHLNDTGWDMSPENIQFALERLHKKYHLPILITENGLADDKDEYRQWWIAKTLAGMQLAMENGVILEGYLHWSLLDNFEWDKGFWPHFGLAAVDRVTGDRTLRPSAVWFGKVIKRLRDQAS